MAEILSAKEYKSCTTLTEFLILSHIWASYVMNIKLISQKGIIPTLLFKYVILVISWVN